MGWSRLVKNIKNESTKAVANYGGYAALALQVVPGVGTAAGLAVGAAAAAAQNKLGKQEYNEALGKQQAEEAAYHAEQARIAGLSDPYAFSPVNDVGADNKSLIVPETPEAAKDTNSMNVIFEHVKNNWKLYGTGLVVFGAVVFYLSRRTK